MRKFNMAAGLALILISSSLSEAAVYTVRPDGTGDFATIQAAIDSLSDGDVVELTNGVFSGIGNEYIDFTGKAIAIRSQSGEPDSCIVDGSLDRGFECQSGEGPGSVLQDITIANCSANDGAGLYCIGSSPTVRNVVFSANAASFDRFGGAVFCADSSAPVFIDCTFVGNEAGSGGGLFTSDSNPTLTNCVFTENDAGSGSGLYCNDSTTEIIGCTFISNVGNGVFCSGSDILLQDCTISNHSAFEGSGIRFGASTVTLENCTIAENTSSYNGAGILCHACTLSVSNCEFTDNSSGTFGGAVYITSYSVSTFANTLFAENSAERGGAMYCRLHSSTTIEHCEFRLNSATENGGAVYGFEFSEPSISYSLFVDNSAQERGGALYTGTASSVISNCTLVGNSAEEGAGICAFHGPTLTNVIIANSPSGEGVYCRSVTGWPTITHSLIFGNAGGDSLCGTYFGNLFTDPCFCSDSYYLGSPSPCLPDNNSWGELVGAFGQGCTGCDTPGVEPVSWGYLKFLFH